MRIEIGDGLLRFIIDVDETRGKARSFELLRNDERHGLSRKQNFAVVKRAEGRARRGDLVRIFFMRRGEGGPVVVGKHFDHTGHSERRASVYAFNSAFGDRA
jgi:hypothetical protein